MGSARGRCGGFSRALRKLLTSWLRGTEGVAPAKKDCGAVIVSGHAAKLERVDAFSGAAINVWSGCLAVMKSNSRARCAPTFPPCVSFAIFEDAEESREVAGVSQQLVCIGVFPVELSPCCRIACVSAASISRRTRPRPAWRSRRKSSRPR